MGVRDKPGVFGCNGCGRENTGGGRGTVISFVLIFKFS